MSRSVKKHPIIKFAPRQGWIGKRFANKKVRRFAGEIPNGKAYRKLYESWEIHDCVSRETLNEYLKSWGDWFDFCDRNGYDHYDRDHYGRTIQDAINKWKKVYLRK